MSSTMEHFSHPKHQLILKENDIISVDALCYGCEKPVIGSPTYTCTSDNIACQSFYLHKTCAEIPPQIIHPEHNRHSLALQPRSNCFCDVCNCHVKSFAYTCIDCDYDVCILCASLSALNLVCSSEQRELHHEGHQEHTLTLQREASFKCDACYEEGKDSSYVCITCDFWIHKKCAFSPSLIPAPAYHHHPLSLIYSIPHMHRYFSRDCQICKKRVQVFCWHYYCHKCTYFVHMKCAASSDTSSMLNEDEADDTENEPDLIHFPLPCEESLFDLIISQCTKLQLDFLGEGENNITITTKPNVSHVIVEHWSHKNHPLEQLQFIITENDDADDRRVLICNGCIQNITISHPTYYACTQCGFFLHSFCATKLPRVLPVGASQFHPEHSLLLQKKDILCCLVNCGVCEFPTNGFYYDCETCDMKVDIRCAFLPTRIKHASHKHHSLFRRPSYNSKCSVSNIWSTKGMEYACETCNSFQVYMDCTIYPSRSKHRYDDHPITLRLPPFFYEGELYCEICENRLNNQSVLYHCGECDHSFHNYCISRFDGVKLGGTIELSIGNQPHILALVEKSGSAFNSSMYFCDYCLVGSYADFFLECEGCGYLACFKCVNKILGE